MKSFISHELCKVSFVFEASETNKSLYYNHNKLTISIPNNIYSVSTYDPLRESNPSPFHKYWLMEFAYRYAVGVSYSIRGRWGDVLVYLIVYQQTKYTRTCIHDNGRV